MIPVAASIARAAIDSTALGVALMVIAVVLLLGAQSLEWRGERPALARAVAGAAGADVLALTALVVLRFVVIA